MKSKMLYIAVVLATLLGIASFPMIRDGKAKTVNPPEPPPTQQLPDDEAQTQSTLSSAQQAKKVEVVFVLDTTGSMGGLIQAAKEKIWSIATTLGSAQSAPEIKMGLVAYRDRGDNYVTRVTDLSSDLDSMYAQLMDLHAAGGGDGPESVNQALHDAVNSISWSQDAHTYRVVFLVGDAPPHMDYQDDVKYPQTLRIARQKQIVVNAIRCGGDVLTQQNWQHIASLGQGDFFNVSASGSAVAVSTPYDKKMAQLSQQLEKTRMYFGSKSELRKARAKNKAAAKLHAAASEASRARRAEFNTSKSGKKNLLGENELVEAFSRGEVDLSTLKPEQLPNLMKDMPVEQQKQLLEDKSQQRQQLQKEIRELAAKRGDYIRDKVEKEGGAEDSLDEKIYRSVKKQAAASGLHYEAPQAAY